MLLSDLGWWANLRNPLSRDYGSASAARLNRCRLFRAAVLASQTRAIGLYFRELNGLSAAQLSEAANLLIACYGEDVEAAAGDAATDVLLDAEISVLCLSETRNALVCAGYQSDAMCALIVGVVDSRAWPINFDIRICCVAPA